MASDWVKVHRSLMDSAVWSDEWLVKLWIWCLLKANYGDAIFKGSLIKRGQFVTGRNTAADELHVSPSKWYRGMMRLAELGNIELTANSVWTIVTVCNYSTYQDGNGDKRTANEQRMNSQRTADDTTSGQRMTQRADTREEEQEGKKGRREEPDKKRSAAEHVENWTRPTNCQEQRHTDALILWQMARKEKHGSFLPEPSWMAECAKWQHWTPSQWVTQLLQSAAHGTLNLATYATNGNGTAKSGKSESPGLGPMKPPREKIRTPAT